MWSSLVLNVENVRLQLANMLDVDVLQLAIVKAQVVAWIFHDCLFIY
jgi:hypothetical protein